MASALQYREDVSARRRKRVALAADGPYRRPNRDLTREEGKRLEAILAAPPRKPSAAMLAAGKRYKEFMAGK